jgi:hypothetical protein
MEQGGGRLAYWQRLLLAATACPPLPALVIYISPIPLRVWLVLWRLSFASVWYVSFG